MHLPFCVWDATPLHGKGLLLKVASPPASSCTIMIMQVHHTAKSVCYITTLVSVTAQKHTASSNSKTSLLSTEANRHPYCEYIMHS